MQTNAPDCGLGEFGGPVFHIDEARTVSRQKRRTDVRRPSVTMNDILVSIVRESWSVLGQMAPYLLFGFLAAGVAFGVHFAGVRRAAPGRPGLPAGAGRRRYSACRWRLCSCGVIPVAASFRRHGASRAAATSFLLSTPQTGIDSIAITYALLGPVVAVFRPIIAFVTGLFGGVLVWLFGEAESNGAEAAPRRVVRKPAARATGGGTSIGRALEYGFVVLPRDIGGALLLGVGDRRA